MFEFKNPWQVHFVVSDELGTQCHAEFFKADGSKVITPMHQHPNQMTALLGLVRNVLHFELVQENARDQLARESNNTPE